MKRFLSLLFCLLILVLTFVIPCAAVSQIEPIPNDSTFVSGGKSNYINPNGWYELYLDRIEYDESYVANSGFQTPHYQGVYINGVYVIYKSDFFFLYNGDNSNAYFETYIDEVLFIDLPLNSPEYTEVYNILSSVGNIRILYNQQNPDFIFGREIDFYFPLSYYVNQENHSYFQFYWLTSPCFYYVDTNNPLFFIPGNYLIQVPENFVSYPPSIVMDMYSSSYDSFELNTVYFTNNFTDFSIAYNDEDNYVYTSESSWRDYESQIIKVETFFKGDLYGNELFVYYPCADSFLEGVTDPEVFNQAFNEGYSEGYDEGLEDNLTTNIFGNILNTLDSLRLFDTISVLDIIITIIGLFVFVFVLKLIAGG